MEIYLNRGMEEKGKRSKTGEEGKGGRGERETGRSFRFLFPSSPFPLFPFPRLKHVEARTRSPLRIRASTVVTHFTKALSVTKLVSQIALLVRAIFVANLVCINRGPCTTGDCTDNCALLAAD